MTLHRPDYVDRFTVSPDDADRRTAEWWVRAVLERSAGGRSARTTWRLLGLRLGPRNDTHVQGWEVVERRPEEVRLETGSWYMRAEALCTVSPTEVAVSLCLEFTNPVGPLIWRFVEPLHRAAVPQMLDEAAKRFTSEVEPITMS